MKAISTLKYGVGVALICALVFFTGTGDLLQAISNVTLTSIFVLSAIAAVMIFVSAIKWRLFLRRQGNNPTLLRLCNLYLVGYFVNLIMPSYVGGDLVRSLYVAKAGEKHEAFSATFLERYTGLVAMILMAAVGCLVSSTVTFQIQCVVFATTAGLVVGSWLAFSEKGYKLCSRLPLGQKLLAHFDRIQKSLVHGMQDPKLLVHVGLLSLFFHVLTVVNTVAVGYAVGWSNPPALELCVVVPLILLVGAVPLSPQGLGIQEGAFFYFLQTVGATPEQAMAVGLVLRAKGYALALLGGFVWLALKPKSQVTAL